MGLLLVLKAFAAGCSALTGVEAIANDVPPSNAAGRRAQHTEIMLGGSSGTMLIGLAFLSVRFHIAPLVPRPCSARSWPPRSGGTGPTTSVDLSATIIFALAANTSFGGLPVLASLLARDNYLPHIFGLRDDRLVFGNGVWVLAGLAGRPQSRWTVTRTP